MWCCVVVLCCGVVLCCVVLCCCVVVWCGVVLCCVVLCCSVVVVVEWLYYSKRIIIVRWADLSDFFFVDFRR